MKITADYRTKLMRAFFVILIIVSALDAMGSRTYARPTGNPSHDKVFRQFSLLDSDSLMKMGREYYGNYAPDSALVCFTIISGRYGDRSNRHDKDLASRSLVNAGCIYGFFYFDYNLAYQNFRQALDICENDAELRETRAIAYLNLATLLDGSIRRTNSPKQSEAVSKLYDEVIKTATESENWEMLAMAFFNVAEYDYDLNLDKYRKILDPAISDSVPGITFCRLLYKGISQMNARQYRVAREMFRKQLDSRFSSHNPERMKISAFVNIARSYQFENDFKNALCYVDSAYAVASEYNSEDYILFLKNMKSRIYEESGLYEESRRWKISYLQSRDSLQDLRQYPTVEELNLVYEVRQGEEEVRLAKLRNRYMIWIVCLFAVITALILGGLFVLRRKNRDLNQRLRDIYQRNNELIRTQEDLSSLLKACDECELRQNDQERKDTAPKDRYSTSALSEDEKRRLYAIIDRTMNDPSEICNPDFSLPRLVQIAGSNSTYVSQVINEKYHVTFSILLGNSRIKEGCRRIQNGDIDVRNLTLEALSRDLGFKSRTTFVTAFKRVTAMTPSEYISISHPGK